MTPGIYSGDLRLNETGHLVIDHEGRGRSLSSYSQNKANPGGAAVNDHRYREGGWEAATFDLILGSLKGHFCKNVPK